MPVLKYRPFCVVSFANVKNIGLLNVYQYSRNLTINRLWLDHNILREVKLKKIRSN